MALRDRFYTVTETANRIGVTRQTVSRWIRSGDIKTESVGREKLISKKMLERYLNKKIDAIVERYKPTSL